MKAINIIFDESRQKDGTAPEVLFVEIETDDGCSINIGERIKYRGYTKLRITNTDIEAIEEVVAESCKCLGIICKHCPLKKA